MYHNNLTNGVFCSYKFYSDTPCKFESHFSGHLEVVKLLVSYSTDVTCKDKQGYTPLHAAAVSGQLDVIKYLLRVGLEVKCLIKCLSYRIYRSVPALWLLLLIV